MVKNKIDILKSIKILFNLVGANKKNQLFWFNEKTQKYWLTKERKNEKKINFGFYSLF